VDDLIGGILELLAVLFLGKPGKGTAIVITVLILVALCVGLYAIM
jgi:hypothetical protein